MQRAVSPPAHRWLLVALFVAVLLPLYVVGSVAEDVWRHEGLPWDRPILDFLHRHSSPALDTLMLLFSGIGGPFPMAVFVVALLLVLLLRQRRDEALFFGVAVAGAMVLNYATKLLFRRARPDLWTVIHPEHGYSFPSGHAMGSMAVALAATILAWPTRWRWPVAALGAAFALLVGVSRSYLGVHYPSDVLAGWLASVAWVTGMQLARSRLVRARSGRAQPEEQGYGAETHQEQLPH